MNPCCVLWHRVKHCTQRGCAECGRKSRDTEGTEKGRGALQSGSVESLHYWSLLMSCRHHHPGPTRHTLNAKKKRVTLQHEVVNQMSTDNLYLEITLTIVKLFQHLNISHSAKVGGEMKLEKVRQIFSNLFPFYKKC